VPLHGKRKDAWGRYLRHTSWGWPAQREPLLIGVAEPRQGSHSTEDFDQYLQLDEGFAGATYWETEASLIRNLMWGRRASSAEPFSIDQANGFQEARPPKFFDSFSASYNQAAPARVKNVPGAQSFGTKLTGHRDNWPGCSLRSSLLS
jgi:hypothetical protein